MTDYNLADKVSAAANITDNALVRGADGAKGVQLSTVLVSDAGEMTNPSQPAFLAYVGTTLDAVTGNGVAVNPVIFNTEVFDQGGDYAVATGIFTAPVIGKFKLTSYVRLADLAAGTGYRIRIITSNRTYFISDNIAINIYTNKTITIEALVDMDAADTASIYISVEGGTQTVDISGAAVQLYSWFSGFLAC